MKMQIPELNKYHVGAYSPGRSKLIQIIWYFTNALIFDSYFFTSYKFKCFILRLFGAKISNGVVIKPKVKIKYPWKLSIGNNSWIGEEVWIDNLENVFIGDNVCLSQRSFILTGNHNYKSTGFDLIVKEVFIENGAWLGASSVVCPGVKMEEGALLTVGGVLTKNALKYGVYSGNPAVLSKTRIIST